MSARRSVVAGLVLLCVVGCVSLFASAPALAAPLEIPELTVEDSTAVVAFPSTEARLHGVLNPQAAGEGGIYQFLYNASKTGVCAGGSVAPASPGMSFGFEREEYFETVPGLTPGTEYAVCLRVENDAKTESKTSAAVSFRTPVPPEKPETVSPAASVTATTAKLEGVLNPLKAGEVGTYEFLYRVSATECEGERSSPEPAGVMSGAAKQAVSAPVSALEPNATYTFCLRARNAAGEVAVGSVVHFTTPAAPPTILSESVSHHNKEGLPLATGEARLEGTLNPNNQLSECHFQYGEGSVEEHEVPCEPEALKGFGEDGVAATISSLSGAPYHYRILAKNGKDEEATGSEKTVLPPEVPVKPTAPEQAVTAITATTATLHGVLNPHSNHEAEPGTYEFVYRQSATECQRVNPQTGREEDEKATPATAATGAKGQTVQAPVAELLSGAKYTFCLLAKNNAGEEALGLPETFTALASAPLIEESSVSDVASSSATFSAKINPRGSETTYRFEYGTGTSHESSAPVPDGQLGSGSTGTSVTVHIQGLAPSTEYHYRVVALVSSRGEVVPGADGTFTTQPAGGELVLPAGRQWELVSPADKHGALFGGLNTYGPVQAAADGDRIVYGTSVPTEAEPPGYQGTLGDQVQELSTRTAQGWTSRVIAVPHASRSPRPELATEYRLFSPDLSSGLVDSYDEGGTLLSDMASEPTQYIRRQGLCEVPATANECFLPLLTRKEGFADVPPGAPFGSVPGGGTNQSSIVEFDGASPNLDHVALTSKVALTGTAIPPSVEGFEQEELYEWSAGSNPAEDSLEPVSVLPEGEGGGLVNFGFHMSVGATLNETSAANRNAVSANGSRVFWGIQTNGLEEGSGRLYVRDTAKKETLRIDAKQPEAPSGGVADPRFQFANPEGSKVYFTDGQPLTAASAESQSESAKDLYECEIVEEESKLKCRLTDLTPEVGGQPADVQMMLSGASEDGSYAYFVANGVLGDSAERGATRGDCEGFIQSVSVTCNLYEYHEGRITFIATLSGADEHDFGGTNGVEYEIKELTAMASPDGRYFAFMSERPLTGYDNHDANSGEPDEEVYLYDAQTGHLACASCNPTGARPVGVLAGGQSSLAAIKGDAFIPLWVAASVPRATTVGEYGSLYQPRFVDNDGRVFFNSSDTLVPQDIDGAEDVYEYEPEDVGSCTSSSSTFEHLSGGCASLISSGASPEESGFLDASEGGSDVFFLTATKLVSQDFDTSYDVYDAHECSATAPCTEPPASPPPCETVDSCKAAPTPQPSIYGSPSSATFTGAGNLASPPKKPTVKQKPSTRTRMLAAALRRCRSKRGLARRACEATARRRYRASAARDGAKITGKRGR